jgi:hypothetical protein
MSIFMKLVIGQAVDDDLDGQLRFSGQGIEPEDAPHLTNIDLAVGPERERVRHRKTSQQLGDRRASIVSDVESPNFPASRRPIAQIADEPLTIASSERQQHARRLDLSRAKAARRRREHDTGAKPCGHLDLRARKTAAERSIEDIRLRRSRSPRVAGCHRDEHQGSKARSTHHRVAHREVLSTTNEAIHVSN